MHYQNNKETKLMGIKFSEWLTQKLAEKDMSQSDLARKSGLTRQAIHYYLSAKSKQPDAFSLKKIADGLGLPVEQVYRAAGVPVSKQKTDDDIEEIMHQVSTMSEPEKKRVLDLILWLKSHRTK